MERKSQNRNIIRLLHPNNEMKWKKEKENWQAISLEISIDYWCINFLVVVVQFVFFRLKRKISGNPIGNTHTQRIFIFMGNFSSFIHSFIMPNLKSILCHYHHHFTLPLILFNSINFGCFFLMLCCCCQ